MPRKDNIHSPWRVPLALVLAFLAFPSPAPASAHDGTWAQLGEPFRFAAPLLWDVAGGRLVGLGASAFGSADSIEDAWEFREATGWRRIRLPQPPAGVELGLRGPVADPARRRYLHLAYADASYEWLRLWALELGSEPYWTCLDSSTAAPDGHMVVDLSGEVLWVESYSWYPGGQGLWCRALADTGVWRRARTLPTGGGYMAQFVDDAHDRAVAVRFDPDSTEVLLLPLSGDQGWTLVPTGSPTPTQYPRLVVPDAARSRVLCFMADDILPRVEEVWALNLAGDPSWELLGDADYRVDQVDQAVYAISSDSLVLHGQGSVPERPGTRTIAVAMQEPTHARVLSDPVWPRASRGEVLVRDAARGRWLLVGGRPATEMSSEYLEFLGGPLDSLWELTVRGAFTTWRRVTIDGVVPARSIAYLWTVDESDGTLYLLNGYNTAGATPAGVRELWALRSSDPPRWELLATGGADDWPRLGCGVFVFDSVRRRLVSFGFTEPGAGQPLNEVWEFDVDRPSGWSHAVAAGEPIGCPSQITAAFDAASSRVVALGLNGEVAILVTSPELRWESVPCPDYTTDPCLAGMWGRGAVYDPVGRRLMALGEYDPFWLNVGRGSSLFELSVGDSVGVSRLLETTGTPGWQAAPTFGYDPDRDALLVYGVRQGGWPVLQEYLFDREGRVLAKASGCEALVDRIALRWTATPGANVRLWRHAPAGEWTSRADLHVSASGELAFDDRAIEAGVRYGYRLTTATAPFAPASADVWFTSSVAPSFSLARAWPNPSRGSLNFAFTLEAAAPAELDVFDVAGRRVWSRRWETMSAGPHHLALATSELPRAGLYFVRLRQDDRTATLRFVVAP